MERHPCSWIGRIIIKMSILPQMTFRFNAILIKITVALLQKQERILKFMLNQKEAQILRKKNKAEGVTFPDFKMHYKFTIIKRV